MSMLLLAVGRLPTGNMLFCCAAHKCALGFFKHHGLVDLLEVNVIVWY